MNETRRLERDRLIARVTENRRGIRQIFLDVDHWNRIRSAGEPPIVADPDGELARALELCDNLEAHLRGEQ